MDSTSGHIRVYISTKARLKAFAKAAGMTELEAADHLFSLGLENTKRFENLINILVKTVEKESSRTRGLVSKSVIKEQQTLYMLRELLIKNGFKVDTIMEMTNFAKDSMLAELRGKIPTENEVVGNG